MEDKSNNVANITLQFLIAGSVMLMNALVTGAVIWNIIFSSHPDESIKAAFNIILGNAMGWLGALVSFGFPSNVGNANKDKTIQTLATAASAPTTTTTTTVTEKPNGPQTATSTRPDETGTGSTAGVLGGRAEPTTEPDPDLPWPSGPGVGGQG